MISTVYRLPTRSAVRTLGATRRRRVAKITRWVPTAFILRHRDTSSTARFPAVTPRAPRHSTPVDSGQPQTACTSITSPDSLDSSCFRRSSFAQCSS